ncbi:hypothetical protein RHSIM_Rhsim12G0173000 [Rhododendron simsii]|uniref:Uncharacterized protein n=1 Tax=Rhododendron simsii TaxID=118357 RepID=A0A834G517_RHOSS|nr:hypothetical protein RHSIM_Rhsim12G0173000 [Rhododendron simsii]
MDHLSLEKPTMPGTLRPLGNFLPSLWGDRFSSFTLDTQLLEKYSKEVEVLKEEVKDLLVLDNDDVGGGGKSGAEKMVLIDALERLGVSYLFEKEIEELLESMFPKFEENSHVFHDNLFMVSLHFRVFRQHGYDLSSETFERFTDSTNGEFKETISNDVMGMLSLYEATFLKTHGEDILDKAFCFTKAGLESLKPQYLSSNLAEQVTHALYQPLQRGIPRVEARHYISVYEKDASRNQKLLRLAKIDFNRVQMLHKEELCHIFRWWKEWDLRSHIPYVRDRAVECFFYSTAVCFEPQYSLARLVLTKTMIMISVLDDTYDAYGTYEELKCFTNAVQRWDMNAIDQLPKYMKPIYKALLNVRDEFYQEIMAKKEINYSVQYLEEAFILTQVIDTFFLIFCFDLHVHSNQYKEVVRCYDVETEWSKKGYVQTMEEHLANALVTVTSPLLTTAAFVGMGEIATPEAFQWLQSKPRILMACSTIFRVINDIQSCKTEDERSHVATGVECYMKQHGVSRLEAISELWKIIENAWIDINEEMMRPTMISRDLVIRILNFACLYGVVYKYNDGYTQPECAKDSIIALYEDSIPI